MGARERASAPGELTPAQLVTVVRRLGFVMSKAHETIMGRLIAQGEHELAERFNDLFKPLVDLVVHFELDELEGESK